VGGSPPHMLLLLDPANIPLAIGARPAMPAAAALLQSENAPRMVVILPCLLDCLSGLGCGLTRPFFFRGSVPLIDFRKLHS